MLYSDAHKAALIKNAREHHITPRNCPLCEYDRRFPGFECGGWMQQDNNGPIVSCPMCNADESQPRQET